MLTSEQSKVFRAEIARIFRAVPQAVIPEARLYGDLGGTAVEVAGLQSAIEALFPVQLDPVVREINARTAIDSNGLLTDESMTQIAEYLGMWPGFPETNVSFPDLFSVAMAEAMLAKAIDSAGAPADDEPLVLSPELAGQVHQVVARVYDIPLADVTSRLELVQRSDEEHFDFAMAMIEIRKSLGISFDVEVKQLKGWFGELADGTATELTMRRLRRLVPDIDSLSETGTCSNSTVGMIERLCAAAIERRESPEAARTHPRPRDPLGLYLSTWTWSDQDWWASVPEQMGAARFRLYLAGMLRAAYMQAGSMDGEVNELLEVAEKFAETASNPATLERKFQSHSKRRKFWRFPFWNGMQSVLKRECTPEDGGNVLDAVAKAFEWGPRAVVAAARQWQQSMFSPLQRPAELKAEWCTSEVSALALQMHENRAYVEIARLGTLLQDAGCDVTDILDHCRDSQRRHLRGDWLIAAILEAASPAASTTSRGKGARRTASPRKPKLPAMSTRDKKRFKELLVTERGGLPVAAAWASVWQLDHSSDEESFKKKDPRLPAGALTALGGMYPSLRAVMPDTAVARRLQLQSVAELQLSLILNARIELMAWHTSPGPYKLMERFRDAFAAGDETALQWCFRELPCLPIMDSDVTQWSYLAYRAIFSRDNERADKLIESWPHPDDNSNRVPSQEKALLAILRRDPEAVVMALNEMLVREGKSEWPEGFGAFCLASHACYRAALWSAPFLVAGFDATQGLPWDAEFHAASSAESRPLESFDFSSTPSAFSELLKTGEIPQWLRDLQSRSGDSRELVDLFLKEVGPRPDAVYKQVKELVSGDWNRAEFDHRTRALPIVLKTGIVLDVAHHYRDAMQKTGATIEIM